jgi:hypothetical protein
MDGLDGPGLRPDWADRLLQRADDTPPKAKRKRSGKWGTYIGTRATPEFIALIHEACSQRDINLGAYIRRAVAKQVAKDLGVTWEEVLMYTPYPCSYTGNRSLRVVAGTANTAEPDDGSGFGDWRD